MMASNTIDVSTMFTYSSRKNIPWNISEYLPVNQYLDPAKIREDMQRKQKKYKRTTDKIPDNIHEKVFFLDEQIKPLKENPSPDKYKSLSIFDQAQNRKKSKSIKINQRIVKYTYLDWIDIENKKRKQPAVGKYNLNKTEKQIKDEIKALSGRKYSIDEKRHFYDVNQTNQVPGAGTYNPHLQVHIPAKPSRKNYKWWIDQHSKQTTKQKKKQRKSLAPNSYRPISASFNSFDKMQKDSLKLQKKSKDTKINPKLGFTSADARFNYMKQRKVKIEEKRPVPTTYDTRIDWKGKNDQNPRKKGWARCLSAGPSRSIYH